MAQTPAPSEVALRPPQHAPWEHYSLFFFLYDLPIGLFRLGFIFHREGCFTGWFSGFRWVASAVTGCQVDACFGLDCGVGGEVYFARRSSANGPASWCSDHHPLIAGLFGGQGGRLQWDSWNLVVGGGTLRQCRR